MATREQNLKHRYGINLVDYDQMLSEQDGKCKICKAEVKRLVVDHCHTSKRVRGLLCHHCNTGIGMLKESENIMREAMNYINEHNVKKERSIDQDGCSLIVLLVFILRLTVKRKQ